MLEDPITFEYDNNGDEPMTPNVYTIEKSLSVSIQYSDDNTIKDKTWVPENVFDNIGNQSLAISGVSEIREITQISNPFNILDNNPAAVVVNNDTPKKKNQKRDVEIQK